MSLFGTKTWRSSQEKLIYSVDLTEATYNISHDLMRENFNFLDDQFGDNPVWEVYGDLLRIPERTMDLTVLVSQGFNTPSNIAVQQGSFMGDGMSFLHLTLVITCLVNLGVCRSEKTLHKVLVKRPLGQSVGDDLLLLDVSPKTVEKLDQELEKFGLPTSKIHSAFITGVFAEQYFKKILKAADRSQIESESLFGDLWFVDSIKTMLLTGRPKVSSEKRNSFIGQANALNKQLAYLPDCQDWKRLKARIYLWANNYNDAIRIGRAKPHLPPELGGLNIPLGACDRPTSALMRERYLPYFAGLAKLSQEEFLGFYLILKGIFKSSPKGVPWSNEPDRITALCSVASLASREDVDKSVKDFEAYSRMGQLDRLRYLNRTHNWVSASEIDDELSRRESYLEFWYEPEKKRAFRTLKSNGAVQRHDMAWSFIRQHVIPSDSTEFENEEGFLRLAALYRHRLWGFFVRRDDPAISWIFENVNTFWLDIYPT
jgi:hypothetical protein